MNTEASMAREGGPELRSIAEMAAHPSEQALLRMQACTSWVFDAMHFEEIPSDQQLLYVIREQNLGYYDEAVAALHAPDEAYHEYLQRLALDSPITFLSQPGLFEGVISDETAAIVCRNTDIATRYKMFERICKVAPQDDVVSYANELLTLCPKQSILALGLQVLHADEFNYEEKRKLFQDSMTMYPAFWDAIGFRNFLAPFPHRYKDQIQAERDTLNMLDELIAQGYTSMDEIYESVDVRIKSGSNNGVYTEYVIGAALDARLWLDLQGFSGRSKLESIDNYLIDGMNVRKQFKNGHLSPRILAWLVRDDNDLREHVYQVLQEYDAEYGSSVNDEFDSFVKVFEYDGVENRTLWHKIEGSKLTESNLLEIMQTLPDATDERGYYKYRAELFEVLYASEELKEYARQIVELSVSKGYTIFTYRIEELSTLFDGFPERIRAIIDHTIEGDCLLDDINLEHWEQYVSHGSSSRDQLKDKIRSELEREDSLGGLMENLGDNLRAVQPLFSVAECAELVKSEISHLGNLSYQEQEYFIKFCQGYLGRAITESVFADLPDNLAVKDIIFGTEKQKIIEQMNSPEYFEVLEGVWSLAGVLHKMSAEDMEQIVTHAIDMFSTEHIADTLWLFWPYMDASQKEQCFDRLAANPALLCITLQLPKNERRLRTSANNRMLTAGVQYDALQAIAPKSYAKMVQRLQAKELSHEVQLERTGAQQVSPKSIEAKRASILLQYAYVYDLCDRLRDCGEVADTLKQIRGKNIEKNELRALEAMVLFHENYPDLQLRSLADVLPEQRDQIVFAAVMQKLGLHDDQIRTTLEYMGREGIDLVKYSMLIHTSMRSNKLTNYYSNFMAFIGNGNTIADWKIAHATDEIFSDQTDRWSNLWWEDIKMVDGVENGMEVHITHNLSAVYLAGSEPTNNCLHYAYGQNQHALAGLLTPDAKMLRVQNAKGNTIANAVLRLGYADGEKVLVLEPVYAMHPEAHWKREMEFRAVASAEAYARQLGMELVVLKTGHGTATNDAVNRLWPEGEHTKKAQLVTSLAPYSYIDTVGVVSSQPHILVASRRKKSKTVSD